MPQEDTEPLIIAKWPFYLGDALLVATAIAIASISQWSLTDWQVVSCVLAVALGAFLFVLPYLVEYYMRIQEEADDQDAQVRALNRRIELFQTTMDEHGDQFNVITEKFASESRVYDSLANAVDQKVSVVQSHKEVMDRGFEGVAERFSALEAKVTVLNDASGSEDEESDRALQMNVVNRRIDEYKAQLVTLQEQLEAVRAENVSVITELKEAIAAQAKVRVEDKDEVRSKRSARKVRSSPSLLNRALPSVGANKLSAVERIIGTPPAVEPEVVVEPEPKSESAIVETVKDEAVESKPAEPPAEADLIEVENSEVSESASNKEADLSQRDKTVDVEVEDTVEQPEEETIVLNEAGRSELEEFEMTMPEVEPFESSDDLENEKASSETPEDLEKKFDSTVVQAEEITAIEEVKPVVKGVSGANLTAHVLIGIGNKPYLRGSGGGLNWDEGVPMNFEEIGKWYWEMAESIHEPIEFQVYRNDLDADRKGKQLLKPGEKLGIEPKF